MLQVRNSSPFVADFALLPNPKGVDCLVPILKATFEIDRHCQLAEQQTPLYKQDRYRNDPLSSGLQQVGDYHLSKLSTDVLVEGECLLEGLREVDCCDVNITVGDLHKHLRIFGDRYWHNGKPSAPSTFVRMPVIYERAFGGSYQSQDRIERYEDNPIGMGFCGIRSEQEMNGIPLPNIEDPAHLIENLQSTPPPAGIEALPPYSLRRRSFVGTYDDEWRKLRAPYLPEDFSRKYFQCASDGLVSPVSLVGGEPVTVRNMREQGDWHFSLPVVEVDCRVKWANQLYNIPMRIETLLLQPNQSQVCCVWRGEFPVNQWVSRVEYLEFSLVSLR